MKKSLSLVCLLSFLSSSAIASSWQNKLQELKELSSQITHLKLQIKSAHKKKSTLQEQLKNTEADVARLSKNVERVNNDINKQQLLFQQSQNQLADEQSNLQQVQQQLERALKSAYIFSNTDYLKLLLNQQDPNELSQNLAYYRYLLSAQIAAINQFKQAIERIQQQQQVIKNQAAELKKIQIQQQQEQQRLLSEKTKREKLLTTIAEQIQTKAEQLSDLSDNQRSLETLVNQLKATEASDKAIQYQGLQGKHPWPLKGPILAQFGAHIENSELTWKGVLIGASDGQNVQAVAPGKVIFANWLKGFGFLIIVEHGKGYMSLYGRNESLYKKVGDYVHAGDLIARAGRSGGFATSGLYFEIRRNGTPVNPLKWLS